jgi:DNA-binding MarR family transcriptional regulator
VTGRPAGPSGPSEPGDETDRAGRAPGRATGLSTGFASAEESPGLLLWQVTNRWQAAQRAALRPYGLTHVQFVLLASLTWLAGASGETVTQRALADHAVTDPMMTSQVLRALEGRGLVVRGPHPQDARARALSVTAEGRALANRAVAAVEACDAAFFAALADGTPAFAHALRTLRDAGTR